MAVGFVSTNPSDVQMSDSIGDTSSQYRPSIDGLRAVAVLAVCIFHLNRRWLPGGFVGVDVFFVISGFLITSVILRECENDGFSAWEFYQRRIARLLPAFYTMALATVLGAFLIYSAQDFASCGIGLASAVLSIANLKYMLHWNYFIISPDAQPFLHCWSLSVEEQFYMLFPVLLAFLYLKANRYKTAVLGVLCGASLLACVVLTYPRPQWAFFLLPTRGWELLAGSILANLGVQEDAAVAKKKVGRSWLAWIGLGLILSSMFALSERQEFPGYRAVIPVMGAVCFLSSIGGRSWPERFLSTGPMVFVGRMSYSLYLWHWPIFSLVDYRLYLASPLVRFGLKVGLSAASATVCFFFIENPGRAFLNQPSRRHIAFAFLGSALLVCVPLGAAIRRANYIDADMDRVAQGGIAFNQASGYGSMVVMGDSNGSMYGKMAEEVARQLHFKLNVISVSGGDPLPSSSGSPSRLWTDSLAFVERENPDDLVLVCNWARRLNGDRDALQLAVDKLKHHTRRLILVTQPPQLPRSCDREALRNGSRPPCVEDPTERALRAESNAFLRSMQRDNVVVLDIEPQFVESDGSIRFVSADGALLYQDDDHLSDVGADRVKPDFIKAIAN